MNRKFFSIGGCAYQMRVDARVLGSIVMLAMECPSRNANQGWGLGEIDFVHTSNLPAGRCQWLRRMIANDRLSLAISVDSDTSFDAKDLYGALQSVTRGDVGIGLAPVRVGGTSLVNLNKVDSNEPQWWGRRMTMEELIESIGSGREIASGGFGLAVFNLDWFRRVWPIPAPERVSIDTGEDVEFCRSVRDRGGKIIALSVRTDHFAFGERQTR